MSHTRAMDGVGMRWTEMDGDGGDGRMRWWRWRLRWMEMDEWDGWIWMDDGDGDGWMRWMEKDGDGDGWMRRMEMDGWDGWRMMDEMDGDEWTMEMDCDGTMMDEVGGEHIWTDGRTCSVKKILIVLRIWGTVENRYIAREIMCLKDTRMYLKNISSILEEDINSIIDNTGMGETVIVQAVDSVS